MGTGGVRLRTISYASGSGIFGLMATLETAIGLVKGLEPLTTALSMLAATFAGICAWLSYKLAQSIRRELKFDEILIAGILHNPALAAHEHAQAVIQTTIFNKSKRKAYISAVHVYDHKGNAVDVTWADAIDAYGNPLDRSQMIGVVDSSKLCIRRTDGEAFRSVRVEVMHSFSVTPLEITYDIGADWGAYLA